MDDTITTLREHARSIWWAAVDAANPEQLVADFLRSPPGPLRAALAGAERILVVGGGKAGASMAAGVEAALPHHLKQITGLLSVPAESVRPLRAIRLHPGRPAGVNHPTTEGVAGVLEQLQLVSSSTARDVALCLLSGGGSALLPAPVEGVSLGDKQAVTRLLHASGATIDEMNCVRKHLSRIKGGRLAQAFVERGCPVWTLIISDVIGDPLDVIASGPTARDPTTFADALANLDKFSLRDQIPAPVIDHLQKGQRGEIPETLKEDPPLVSHHILGNNARSLEASCHKAAQLGYRVLNLGSFWEGETRQVALVLAGLARGIKEHGTPIAPPACILSGGETTVSLGENPGKGGRNQEFALAAACQLNETGLRDSIILCGGTDGEDGPTDAAGAFVDEPLLATARQLGLSPEVYLARHDAYSFFHAVGGLVRTGMTGTNVMDVRVLLVR